MIACACMGAMYGEPYCYCDMKKVGLEYYMEKNPLRKAENFRMDDYFVKRMQSSLSSPTIDMPKGLDREGMRTFLSGVVVEKGIFKDRTPTRCAAHQDGECYHKQCPQLRDGEPHASGRHCPLDDYDGGE